MIMIHGGDIFVLTGEVKEGGVNDFEKKISCKHTCAPQKNCMHMTTSKTKISKPKKLFPRENNILHTPVSRRKSFLAHIKGF